MMYEVQAKCGHVGRNMYTLKTFAVEAETGSLAAALVRNQPRVKHHHQDAILQVKVIDIDRYREIKAANQADPYFTCHSIQEQRRLCSNLIVFEERREQYRESKPEKQGKSRYDGKQKIRNLRKYMKHNNRFEENDIA